MKGDIVLIPFRFSEDETVKDRPSLVIYESPDEIVAVYISSELGRANAAQDIYIFQNHAEYPRTGLKKSSFIKTDKIDTRSKTTIIGKLGEVGPTIRADFNRIFPSLYQL